MDTDPDLTLQTSNTLPGQALPTERPAAYLVHIYPPGPTIGLRFPLAERPLLLGRDPDCDICIADASVSRRHARLQREHDGYCVIDLKSTNGTAVNKTLVSSCRLKDGDDLRFGNCMFRFLASSNVEARYHEEIHRLTISDPLTLIPNRRYFLQFLERELIRSARYERPLALVMFDIDHFKTINDELGHLAGDTALKELAACVRGVVRKEGLFARFGGEEFGVVLPEATLETATGVAERIRMQVATLKLEHEGRTFQITVSLGVTATVGPTLLSVEEFIRQADERLYQAKDEGRNQVQAGQRMLAPKG